MLNDKKTAEHHTIYLNAHDFVKHERGHFWYIGIGLLITAALVATIYMRDYWSFAVVLAVAIAVFRLAHANPTTHEIKITKTGVYWGCHFFAYHQLRSFWFNTVDGKTTFHLDRMNFNPAISFIVPDGSVDKIFNYLLNALPWHHTRSETLGDSVGRWFRL